jgi:hypothetical protein
VEILLTDGVVWCIASELATQSYTEVGGGWSDMVLKEWASDYWSQPAPTQGSSLVRERERPAGRAITAAAAGRVGTQVTDRGLA